MKFTLTNNQASKYEMARKTAESQSGGFDVMNLRFGTVRKGLQNAFLSPTLVKARAEADEQKAFQRYELDLQEAKLEAEQVTPVVPKAEEVSAVAIMPTAEMQAVPISHDDQLRATVDRIYADMEAAEANREFGVMR